MILTIESLERTAVIAAALANPIRLRIITNVANAHRNGVQINMLQAVAPLELKRSSIAMHIGELVKAGLVYREKSGKHVYLQLNYQAIENFLDLLQTEILN